MAKDFDVSFGGIEQSEQHLNRGGFPGAIGPQKPKNLTAADFEIDIVDRARFRAAPEILKDFGETANSDDHLVRVGIAERGGLSFGRGHRESELGRSVMFIGKHTGKQTTPPRGRPRLTYTAPPH